MANIELTLTPASPTGSMIFTLGAPGPAGPPGPVGPQGPAATVDAGSTTTEAPGTPASVVNSGTTSAAVFDFFIPAGAKGDKGDQGIQGVPGEKGDKGDQGDPGAPGVVYATAPLSYDSGTQTVSIDLSAYATQSYVTSQGFITSAALTPYLTSATAASTYQTLSGMSSYLTTSVAASTYLPLAGGYITGDIQSNNGASYRTYDGAYRSVILSPAYLALNNADAPFGSTLTVEADGITFQSGKQTVHYPGTSILDGYATEAWVSDNYYPLSNPYGYITDAPSDSQTYGRNNGAWVVAGGGGSYLPLSGGSMSGDINLTQYNLIADDVSTSAYVLTPQTLTFTNVNGSNCQAGSTGVFVNGIGGAQGCGMNESYFMFPDNTTQSTAVNSADFLKLTGTGSGSMAGSINMGSNNISAVDQISFISGGKLFSAAPTATQAGTNIGVAVSGNAPTTTVAGDIWIGTNNIFFKDSTNTQRVLINQNTTNTFSAPQIIDTTNAAPALRITQKGTTVGSSRALVVEDSTTPDQNCFIVDQSGNVGVSVSNDPLNPWVAGSSKVEVIGDVKATTFSNGSGPAFSVNSTAAHSGGSDSLDLIVTIGGVNYRIGLRPA